MTRLLLLLTLLVASAAAAQTVSYTHDARGRVLTRTATDGAASTTTTYTYDADGNRLTETTNGAVTAYTWGTQGRLEAVSLPDGRTIRYRYDPEGRRIEETDGVTTTRFRWDQGHLLSETNVAGNELRRYRSAITHGDQARGWAKLGTAAFAFFLGYTDTGTSPVHRSFLHDALSTPIVIVNSDGAIAGRTTYDAFGNVVASVEPDPTLAAKPNRIGFTGYQLDRSTSASPDGNGAIADARYYAKARYYGAALGTFLSVDPWMGNVEYPITLNKYAYANANPTVYFDPDGREGACIAMARDCFGRDMTPREQGFRQNLAVGLFTTAALGFVGLEVAVVAKAARTWYGLAGLRGGTTAAMVEGSAAAESAAALALSGAGVEIPTLTVAAAASATGARALDDLVPPRVPNLPGGMDSPLPPGVRTSDVPTWADISPSPTGATPPPHPAPQATTLTEGQLGLMNPSVSAVAPSLPAIQSTSAQLSTVTRNNQVGNAFDDYVVGTKLHALDERGQLARQERLPTPELEPSKMYVSPDYTAYTRQGDVAFYADAKSGATIPFDAQARGLVHWASTSKSRTLIYYTPDGSARIDPNLINYAAEQNVRIRQIGVR